jgi:hypothetical protein
LIAPHCGAYTSHTWFDLHAEPIKGDARTPTVTDPSILTTVAEQKEFDADTKRRFHDYFSRILRGLVVVSERSGSGTYVYRSVGNLNLSECFNCGEVAVWVDQTIVFPATKQGPAPNPDLPADVLDEFNEASTILGPSPRGAAALLRLAIQKLCAHMGEKGKNIDDDIASMVQKGLSPVVQQALDAVRVVGNESVHPGTLDLKDDVGTASKLFDLVNIIAEQMISNPKHVRELYAKLPEAKRKAIEKRDGKPSL